MTQTGHTPGPWTYSGYADHCAVGRKYHEIVDTQGFEVANQNGILVAANAHLIAEAPDLLEALQAVLENEGRRIDGHSVNCASQPTWASGCDTVGRCDCCYGRARAAIARIEGKS